MRINFYDVRLADDDRNILIKEKGINYEPAKMNCPEEISRMLKNILHMDEFAEEYCYMIALNGFCKILGIFLISKGTASGSLVSPREIFIRALLIGATQIILSHNHPSGCVAPSESDIKLTMRIKEAGELINIRLADHIIVAKNCYFSFEEANLLRKGTSQ